MEYPKYFQIEIDQDQTGLFRATFDDGTDHNAVAETPQQAVALLLKFWDSQKDLEIAPCDECKKEFPKLVMIDLTAAATKRDKGEGAVNPTYICLPCQDEHYAY